MVVHILALSRRYYICIQQHSNIWIKSRAVKHKAHRLQSAKSPRKEQNIDDEEEKHCMSGEFWTQHKEVSRQVSDVAIKLNKLVLL